MAISPTQAFVGAWVRTPDGMLGTITRPPSHKEAALLAAGYRQDPNGYSWLFEDNRAKPFCFVVSPDGIRSGCFYLSGLTRVDHRFTLIDDAF